MSGMTLHITDAVVHEVRPMLVDGLRRTDIYINSNKGVVARLTLSAGHSKEVHESIKPGASIEVTGWVSGGSRYSHDRVCVYMVPFADRLKIGGRLIA